jgi:hypothetical protein
MITDGHHQGFDKSRPAALEQRHQVEIIMDILATHIICNNWVYPVTASNTDIVILYAVSRFGAVERFLLTNEIIYPDIFFQ